MTKYIDTLISVLGVLVNAFLLAVAVRKYESGASPLWLLGGAALFLIAAYTLVRNLRRTLAPHRQST